MKPRTVSANVIDLILWAVLAFVIYAAWKEARRRGYL
jgi:hypothetical protein